MPRPSNTEERRAQITSALMKVMASKGRGFIAVPAVAAAMRTARVRRMGGRPYGFLMTMVSCPVRTAGWSVPGFSD